MSVKKQIPKSNGNCSSNSAHKEVDFCGQTKITPKENTLFLKEEIINDYKIAIRSRHTSLVGRTEVLTGKASFGIFGDGIELPQIAAAKVFEKGDFRTGYYRDQTLEMCLGNVNVTQFFSQLYADPNLEHEPHSGGRQMNSHFALRLLNEKGEFQNQLETKNSISDISPTAGQMSRMLGLAYASKIYRQHLQSLGAQFSNQGNEIVFGSIGDASTSEGVFFETLNAAGVLQVPLLMSVWDNGYGISVPRELQTVNHSISKALSGFYSSQAGKGFDLYEVEGWNYPKLCAIYKKATQKVRTEHKPALIHVTELTQPQGHSSSGSHERYKSKERLQWEKEFCCIKKFRQWILEEGIATAAELNLLEVQEQDFVKKCKKQAWELFLNPLQQERQELVTLLKNVLETTCPQEPLLKILSHLKSAVSINRKIIHISAFQALAALVHSHSPQKQALLDFYTKFSKKYSKRYTSHLYSESSQSPLLIRSQPPVYSSSSSCDIVDGRIILKHCFDAHLHKNPRFFILGEDVGTLGDVNLVFEGLAEKYGAHRVTDTGIREATILGQGIGTALRGLRPLVDIQYLDYFLYAIQTASDDLATLHYRTAGGQKAPVIIRTKGHRLEGIWHTGSPLAMLLGALRGLYLCVPRNMTQAAGMYNTLLQGDNPALVIEVLNAYRCKEKVPTNIADFTVALGEPEILHEGSDLTVVTYGACCRIAQSAAEELKKLGIFIEIIDVQTLLPFDLTDTIVKSIEKTNAVLFFDEDVPGGTTAYMMERTLQKCFYSLDCRPRTLSATENRCAYGRDGDYYCKPQVENVVEHCYRMMQERAPEKYPDLFLCAEKRQGASATHSVNAHPLISAKDLEKNPEFP
jgi:2-oxoisovalerate dehydrogenase E1 component